MTDAHMLRQIRQANGRKRQQEKVRTHQAWWMKLTQQAQVFVCHLGEALIGWLSYERRRLARRVGSESLQSRHSATREDQ